MSAHSRNKGARVERGLRDELARHGWSGASREGWKQVRGGAIDSGDVLATDPKGRERWFECKARAQAFQHVYKLLDKHRVFDIGHLSWAMPDGLCVVATYNPNNLLHVAAEYPMPGVSLFSDKEDRRIMRSIAGYKKTHMCKKDKKGNLVPIQADYLAIKGDRQPFIYLRFI